ncbi:MAG: hypothetical protein OHK0015_21900 [Chloroflexi bacterium OHK40]
MILYVAERTLMQLISWSQRHVRAELHVQPGIPVSAEESALILIAEDDPSVRSLLARVLRARGYTVVEAANGAEALEIAATFEEPCQLLLTDVVMPELNGPELAARLLRDGRAERVIYMTGYADVLLETREPVTVLRKPFTPTALAEAVRDVLSH